MSISPRCDSCKKMLNKPGGLLLSPPDKRGKVRKMHLCVGCFERVMNWHIRNEVGTR